MMTYHFPFNPGDTLYQVISFSHQNCKIIEPIIIDEIIIDKTGVSYVSHEKERLFRGEDFNKELFDSQFEAFKKLTKDYKLPCKLGTTLYTYDISGGYPIPLTFTVEKIMKKEDQIYLMTARGTKKNVDELNTTLFFSEEAAEAAGEEKLTALQGPTM